MSESKYGRLFTERDVQQLVNVARLEGAPETVAELVADWDRNRGLRSMTFPDDEPLFLLRGQDAAAKAATAVYLDECESLGCEQGHLDATEQARADLVGWQEMHPERVKVPD